MASPTPPPPNQVPETAATYERTNIDNALSREQATPPGGTPGAARTGPLDDSQSKASTPMQTSKQGSRKDGSTNNGGQS